MRVRVRLLGESSGDSSFFVAGRLTDWLALWLSLGGQRGFSGERERERKRAGPAFVGAALAAAAVAAAAEAPGYPTHKTPRENRQRERGKEGKERARSPQSTQTKTSLAKSTKPL